MIFASPTYLLTGLVLLFLMLVVLRRKGRSLSYLSFFLVFGLYLLLVLSVIIFPIAPLPESYHDAFRLRTNFVPFNFGACYITRLCLRNFIGNILLTLPLGFGIPFLARLKWQDFIWLPIAVGLTFEALQLAIALLFRSPFRVIDINDVILNALGVWLGYMLFRLFGFLYLFLADRLAIRPRTVFAYVYEVLRRLK